MNSDLLSIIDLSQKAGPALNAPMGRSRSRSLEFNIYPFSELRRLAHLGTHSSDDPVRVNKKLYVTRGARALERRGISNEHQVVSLLEKSGFEVFDPSKSSWREQLEMFMTSSEVFGAFGSHMLSCQFMAPYTKLGIAFPDGLTLNYQSYLPLAFGVSVWRIRANRVGPKDIPDYHLNSDLCIELPDVENFIQSPPTRLASFNL